MPAKRPPPACHDDARLVMYLELVRKDNADLFDHLSLYDKGIRRCSRLRYLANEGLRQLQAPREPVPSSIKSHSTTMTPHRATQALGEPSPTTDKEGQSYAGIFDPPLGERDKDDGS